jgi:CubicO group peptidase (beta-lactamase class C family)
MRSVLLQAVSITFIIGLSLSAAYAVQPADTTTPPAPGFAAAISRAETMPRLYSLLVSWRGSLVLERYFNGSGPEDVISVKSVSKSIISALVGIAIEQGHISGVDQAIGEYFGGRLQDAGDMPKRLITIENLLTMQGGLETTSNRNYGAWVLSPDWVGFVLQQPLQTQPGTVMQYSTGNTHLLSAILTRATGKSTLEYAREVLGAPLGFRLAAWPRDPQGIYFGGNDMEMTARQMLAFGELYLNRGRANGKQVVPAAWIEKSLQRHAPVLKPLMPGVTAASSSCWSPIWNWCW